MANSDKSILDNSSANFMNLTQIMFSANPFMGTQAKHFWKAQEQILKEAESFMSAWFQRRHDATTAAMNAASQMGDDKQQDPAAIMQAMTDWQSHSMERLAEDAKEYSDMMTRCVDSLVYNEIEAVEETAKKSKRTAKLQESTPA